MIECHSRQDIIDYVSEQRASGQRIGFVPTMGNLHDGHLSLIERASGSCERVVVSIYVNPMQFDQESDLQSYPRTLSDDLAKLAALPVDAVFLPSDVVLYPDGLEYSTTVSVPQLSEMLCGAHRPGHFDGVSTVVCKLFGIVRPDVAVFGSKDFQQLMIIRHMVSDLCLPIGIEAAKIVREADGLAMSSRNSRLSASERAIAPRLHQVIEAIAKQLREGARDYADLEREGSAQLEAAGFDVDYLSIRQKDRLQVPPSDAASESLVVLAAAALGSARLIDNIAL